MKITRLQKRVHKSHFPPNDMGAWSEQSYKSTIHIKLFLLEGQLKLRNGMRKQPFLISTVFKYVFCLWKKNNPGIGQELKKQK